MSTRVFDIEPWAVATSTLNPDEIRLIESMTSTGNGHMGLRGNFEEGFGGDTHQGTYIAGVWFPDKTRVGWWKNGYPEYFGKVVNAMNFIAIGVEIDGEPVDLFTGQYGNFTVRLDLRNGVLTRSFDYSVGGATVRVEFERFLSIVTSELSFQRVSLTALKGSPQVTLRPEIDGDVHNLDSNYGEQFWDEVSRTTGGVSTLTARTKPNPFGTPQFTVTSGMSVTASGLTAGEPIDQPLRVGRVYTATLSEGEEATLEKTVAVVTSRDIQDAAHVDVVASLLSDAASSAFDAHREAHAAAWESRWSRAAVVIEGDDEAQQGIQFNLFQLFATYYGEDDRLNVGPKGFTGEKYGGATYWDTEAYLVPLYLALADSDVTRSLLQYRHNQLPEAQHNARQQGLAGALYPMVTFTGVECHNEWEITFEEIHRNGAMAYAIDNYTRYTGDRSYLEGPGIEVLIEISRFWEDRVHYSARNKQFMIHGVTGPNEYENNVNNNWYTNYLARWVLRYTAQTLAELPDARRTELEVPESEVARWIEVADGMYFPEDEELGIKVQHDTFLDKDLQPATALDPAQRPLNQNWSWDRVLRSCYIKQADVLQGMYLFEDDFTEDELRRNFEFYEPMTVHESSLSPSVHAVIAARLGLHDKAVELYQRTARLDLDDYNNDTEDGLHITSMSGSWLAIVQGFAGMRVRDGLLGFAPFCPPQWTGYRFNIGFRGSVVGVYVTASTAEFTLVDGQRLDIAIGGHTYALTDTVSVPLT